MSPIFFKIFNLVIVFLIGVAVTLPSLPVKTTSDIETHLIEYSELAENHHDNIDDTSDSHSHIHKHSEDGEEHEHNHDHSKFSEVHSKTLYFSNLYKVKFIEFKNYLPNVVSSLVSDPHVSGIFKPPRV